tara:strand:+ start:1965 stop:2492 length:528 start_codon:yes stop_codon:yes gene_type:complete
MKKTFLSVLALVLLFSCAEPTPEEAIKSALETQLNQPVSEVEIKDTVLVIALQKRLLVIDSTLLEYGSKLKKLEATRADLEVSLKETEMNLSGVNHPALVYGFSENMNSLKQTIESYNQMIDENIKDTEALNIEREQINRQITTANETIAYMEVSVKVNEVINNYMVDPDLKIID